MTGRVIFEEVISQNLDIGRSSEVQRISDLRVSGRTSGKFRTRVITYVSSLQVDYKNVPIKEYQKEGLPSAPRQSPATRD